MTDYDDTTIGQIADESFLEEPEVPYPKAAREDASKMRIEELNPTLALAMWFYVGMRFERFSEIQTIILRYILNPPHKNLFFDAPIGSGKSTTLVFSILFRVEPELKRPQAICIAPNRYLAIQNKDLLLKRGERCPITCGLCLPEKPHVEAQVIIGTPITIGEWIVDEKLGINGIKLLVIDDLDHVLTKGFKDFVLRIIKYISKKSPQCQVIMSSSIFNAAVEAFVSETEQVLSKDTSLDNLKQYKVNVPSELSKINIIKDKILSLRTKAGQTIIYVHTKESASMLREALEADSDKFKVKPLDGADTREQRDKIFKEFEEKQFEVLISTVILDQMFDQSQVDLVVFCDLSIISGSSLEPDLEKYSHCIGRKGAVFNLMCGYMDKSIMEKIETLNNVTEVLCNSDVEFEDALKGAGL